MDLPIVLGSSFTGLLVSHALARRGIEHLVIGEPRPAESPRLGESVSEGMASACWDLLGPVYRPFFHEKSHVTLACGELASIVRLAEPSRELDALGPVDPRRASPSEVGARLVHLDRARLDPMLYDEVREHPACTFVEARAREVEHERGHDRIVAVRLDDGRRLEPRVLFDATGYRGMVATAARLVHRPLGGLRRMVWLHLYRDAPVDPTSRPWWRRGTNLVRLMRRHDGIDGLGWMIPLGDEVSLGLDVDATLAGADRVGDAMLVDALVRAFEQRGMPVRRTFPRAGAVRHLTHRHYIRERAHGANWMLVGTAYGRVWSPLSASLAVGAMAAWLAPRFLDDPAGVGARYEAAGRERLFGERRFIDGIAHGVPQGAHELYRLWEGWRGWTRRRVLDELRLAAGLPSVPTAARGVLGRSKLWGLAREGFARVQAVRVREPSQWAEPFVAVDRPRGFGVRGYVRGWASYLGAAAGEHARRDPGAPRATRLGEESGVVTGR